MVIRVRLVDESPLKYEGVFNVDEFMRKIDETIDKMGYEKREMGFSEKVTESSKEMSYAFEPWKRINSYIKYVFVVQLSLTDVKNTTQEHDGKKKHLQTGKVSGRFSSFIDFSSEWHWSYKPIYYFLLGVIDKYVWPIRWYSIFSNYNEPVNDDLGKFKYELKSFLNMYKHKGGKKTMVYEQGSDMPDKIKDMQ